MSIYVGSLLRPVLKHYAPKKPYVIGLAGGSASGKSTMSKRLEKLGAAVVDCDGLGHKAYEPGTECFGKVVEAFGEEILDEAGKINRAALGRKVFGDSGEKDRALALEIPEWVNTDSLKQRTNRSWNPLSGQRSRGWPRPRSLISSRSMARR